MTAAATPVLAPSRPRPLGRIAAVALLFAAFALVPAFAPWLGGSYVVSLMTRVVALALAAVSLDLLIGYAGLVSFGHAAFLGIGAYAVGILSAEGVDDLALQLAAAVAASALFALVTGAIALKTRGVYFIMITLAFGQMLFFLATSLAAYGGDDGTTLSGRSRVFGRDLLAGDTALYGVSLAALAAGYLVLNRVTASRFGRVLRGARDSEIRMEAIGFAPFRFQLAAYGLAGAVASVAGVLLANGSGFVSPAVMTWQRSADLIFMVVLGGTGSLAGPIAGAAILILTEEALGGLTEHWRILFGPLVILAVLFGRGGLAGVLRGRR